MSREYSEKFKIVERKLETPDIVSLKFDTSMDAEPGQFVMLWIPDIGEKPFSLCGNDPAEIAVKSVGHFTEVLFEKYKGSEVYLRGPYGRPFPVPDDGSLCLVGGGCGIAPLSFLSRRIEGRKQKSFLGAKSEHDLFFIDRFPEPLVTTDDGSYGIGGEVTKLFDCGSPGYDSYFYICGPEKMMAAAAEYAARYTQYERIYLCTERYMKCGRGVCGSCEIDGYRSCVDGPVIRYDQLIGGDFGCRRRDKSGARVEV